MYNQDYEEYMRSVLGYSPNYQDTTYRNNDYYGVQNQSYYNEKLEMMYPEIYRTVYPLVLREVGMNSRSLTEDTIDEMVDRIYNEIEGNQNTNRSIEDEKKDVKVASTASTTNLKNTKNTETNEDRQFGGQRNNILRDLIRILLLRELLGRPGVPNRPPMPGRPPFPGGPGMPPPPRPRDYYV